jgi:spore maturation protein CgeB
MPKAKRIFFIGDTKDLTEKLLLVGVRKQVKGFIRLGHDIQVFSYNNAILQSSLFKNNRLMDRLYKPRADKLLIKQIKNYNPDIIFVTFAKNLDVRTIEYIREASPGVVLVGLDVDLWPELHEARVETAAKLDMIFTTYSGDGQKAFEDEGVHCVFLPNMCDPDIEHRYEVSDKWKSDILFTGKLKHIHYPTEDLRYSLVDRLSKMKNCSLYGCCGRDFIGGIQYFYAISGAKIALSINAVNNIKLYHSDRLTQYLACGTFVLAKRVPDTDLLFKDGEHLRYFDTIEEFFDLAQWYLDNEQERRKIANAGMEWAHQEFNCEKMCKYILEAIVKGNYKAPWTHNS